MHEVFRLKHHLRAEPLDDERVFLISERDRILLQGRLHALVVPLVDGKRTLGELIELLAGRATPPEVYYVLTRLQERGYLTESTAPLEPEAAGFWESLGLDVAQAAQRLSATPVMVRATGNEEVRPLIEALEAAGVTVQPQADVCLLLCSDYLAAEVEAWSREARPGTRWMPVKTAGVECWMGPMLGAAAAPCWTCLAARLSDNRPVEGYLRQRRGSETHLAPPRVQLRASARAGLELAALALARWIAEGGKGALDEHLLSFDAGALRLQQHAVVRRPQCSSCGNPELVRARAEQPIVLESRPKRFTADGGHRCMTPEETLALYQHHVSPITGVLGDLRSVGGTDPLRQVYSALFRVRPPGQRPSFGDFHHIASGKGRTAEQARAGALAEAIERYSAVFRGDENRVRARLSELGSAAVHPHELQGFSEAQYQRRQTINPREEPRRAVPLRYDGDAPIDWTPVWSLTHGRRRYVPTSFCYLNAPPPLEEQFCYFNSNGNAAGNGLEEAILQGFLELVERDAVALWWYNRLRRPRVELQSFGEPYFLALQEYYNALGLRLWVLDITHDLELPSFVAVAWASDSGRLWVGCGCHFEARLAVQRALTEVNQCVNPRDLTHSSWTASALGDSTFLLPEETAVRSREDYSEFRSNDLRDDVQACVERASRAGL
ncbi:TOMM precursor leader peptide-binding protein, partial [Hyalangium sp.]|uniref:TOMM precursor leader peptide-binding protein n=1 Tax=Hyalangium sp. TaxID=2028555 RepID=UPI002D503855